MADSKKIDDGGPAYPQNDLSGYGMGPSERDGNRYTIEGMSLRDYFASQALLGIIIGNQASACVHNFGTAKDAYLIADYMIEARKAGA